MNDKKPKKKLNLDKQTKQVIAFAIGFSVVIAIVLQFNLPNEKINDQAESGERINHYSKAEIEKKRKAEGVDESIDVIDESIIEEEEIASEPVPEGYTAEQQVLVDELNQKLEITLDVDMSDLTIRSDGFTDEIIATVITSYFYGAKDNDYATLYNPYHQSINDVIEDTVANFNSSNEYTYVDYAIGEIYYMDYSYLGEEHTAYSIPAYTLPDSRTHPSSFRIDDLNDEHYENNMKRYE